MTKYTQNDINNIGDGKTDWKKVEKLTDEDIRRAALADKDAPLISDCDANKFKPRKLMRHKLGL
ncbi:hypothetical protein [Aliikangiella maris]|uniref:Uncharacterized protein n=2 Tax=Aliikangiella maris TaxID=3162458 RepID=A0ABV2BNH8_9GAMM